MKIVIHGGAGEDSLFLQRHQKEYSNALHEIICKAQELLLKGRSAVEVVREAVVMLEDNPLFNAGRGSALTADGNIEMDAAIMDGSTKSAGGVTLITNARNPIRVADTVRRRSPHMLLGGVGADRFATENGLVTADLDYFITPHQRDFWEQQKQETAVNDHLKGTVGAVAVDLRGNVAAATSTGGITGKRAGRIGDSCIVGAGVYADNDTCAVSGTGDGEILMGQLTAFQVANQLNRSAADLQAVCELIVMNASQQRGDVGIIAVSSDGQIGLAFNSERMPRAWIDDNGKACVAIYRQVLK
ncbi:isoaspartyl peptidase/L-asparaginase family protein [Sphingobacterium thalpophilum]|uniref:isoaspartyl peptidase/L-asparaginase family protein n=1 Tax=Sphingobacterium thalpophilum TaxID=259 RepID=UPI0024A64ADB|nr:isoaspartyl peptidase/L-asparaginase [Sphingobacterium thalpophilum]